MRPCTGPRRPPRIGCTSDEALIKLNLLDEETYYRALAAEMGFAFLESDFAVSPQTRFPDALLLGMARLARDFRSGLRARAGGAPRGLDAEPQAALRPGLCDRDAHGLDARRAAQLRRGDRPLRQRARRCRAAPLLPGRRKPRAEGCGPFDVGLRGRRGGICSARSLGLLHGALRPDLPGHGDGAPRRRARSASGPPIRPSPRASDEALPTYTVIVPMRREHRVLPRLVASLRALDYPPPKLQAIIAYRGGRSRDGGSLVRHAPAAPFRGAGGAAGRAAHQAAGPQRRSRRRARRVPVGLRRGGRAEPRISSGSRSRPSPSAPAKVACLQARLVIDNADDNWLTRFFTLEYAALFDVINPGLAALDLPVPLGGTSNHFRTAVLRELGGWDAWNVTEDADLGIRLARAGYRVRDLPSATLEEAPLDLAAWMRPAHPLDEGLHAAVITHSRHPGARAGANSDLRASRRRDADARDGRGGARLSVLPRWRCSPC